MEDKARVQIIANSPGSAIITCVTIFPAGEKLTFTSTVHVADNVGSSSVDMNKIMRQLPRVIEKDLGYVYLPYSLTKDEINLYGFDGLCGGNNSIWIEPKKKSDKNSKGSSKKSKIIDKTTNEVFSELQELLENYPQLYVEYNGVDEIGDYRFSIYGDTNWRAHLYYELER